MTANAVSIVQRQTPVIRGAAADPVPGGRPAVAVMRAARHASGSRSRPTRRQGRLCPSQGVRYAHSGDVCRLTQLSRQTNP
jgi:hypothetical protein